MLLKINSGSPNLESSINHWLFGYTHTFSISTLSTRSHRGWGVAERRWLNWQVIKAVFRHDLQSPENWVRNSLWLCLLNIHNTAGASLHRGVHNSRTSFASFSKRWSSQVQPAEAGSDVLQFFSIAFTHLANHGSTSSNAHIFFAQQESSLANGLTISHCFHTNFFEF